MAITTASEAIDLSPSSTSLSGLDGINFFLAGMQAGFGPFVAVLLADDNWTQQNIGFVLSASGLAGLLSQLPGGELLDVSRSKRFPRRAWRSRGRGQCAPDCTLADPPGGFCCFGAARSNRRHPWAGRCRDKPGSGWSYGPCRKARSQSTLRLGRSFDRYRIDGRHWLFFVLSGDILCFGRAGVSIASRYSACPFRRYPLRPLMRTTRPP